MTFGPNSDSHESHRPTTTAGRGALEGRLLALLLVVALLIIA